MSTCKKIILIFNPTNLFSPSQKTNHMAIENSIDFFPKDRTKNLLKRKFNNSLLYKLDTSAPNCMNFHVT